MTEERLKLIEEAEVKIEAIIDTLSQDKGGLADKLKQEDVKDFLVSLWVDCSTEKGKQLTEKDKQIAEKDNSIHELRYLVKSLQNNQDEMLGEHNEHWQKLLEEKDKQIEELCNMSNKRYQEAQDYNDKLEKENLDFKVKIAELKKQLYSDNRNVFAELNDETAQSNEELILKIADLEAQNTTLLQNLDDAMSVENALKQRLEEKDKQIEELQEVRAKQAKLLNQDTERIMALEAQIEKIKSDVTEEIGFAKNFDELHTYSVLDNLLSKWENEE